MASKAMIGNVVLGLGVIGLGALVMAERGVTEAKNDAAAMTAAVAEEPTGTGTGAMTDTATGAKDEPAAVTTVAAAMPVDGATTVPAGARESVPPAVPEPVAVPAPAKPAAPKAAARPADEDVMTCEAPENAPGVAGDGRPLPARGKTNALLDAIPAARVRIHVVQAGDTLSKLSRAAKVTSGLIRRVNGLETDVIRLGERLAIPQGPFRGEVDRQAFTLAIHLDGHLVRRYSIGTGRGGSTPEGEFEVRSRVEDPEWTSPEGDFFRAGDPANPLGSRWLGFGESGYGIHGTTDPSSIGREASRGCVRLNGEDVLEVYDLLALGAKVVIK